MDLTDSEQSLQNTSPDPGPAAVSQLTTEVTAQAAALVQHKRQLEHLTTLTNELVHAIRGLKVSASSATTDQPSGASPSTASATVNPRLALPEKFDGASARCKGFLLQCRLYFDQQPTLHPTDSGKLRLCVRSSPGRHWNG